MGKKLIARTVLGVAAMVLGTAAFARADEQVIAKVPFAFIVGQVHMPAGEYVVTQLDDRSIVSIASADRTHFSFALTNTIAPEDAGPVAELVFERVGSNYFLHRIIAGGNEGREIPLPSAVLKQAAERVAVAVTPASTITATR